MCSSGKIFCPGMLLWGKSDEKVVTFFQRKFSLMSQESLKFFELFETVNLICILIKHTSRLLTS